MKKILTSLFVATSVATLSNPVLASDFVPQVGNYCPNKTRSVGNGLCKVSPFTQLYWKNPQDWDGGKSCRYPYFYSEGYCVN